MSKETKKLSIASFHGVQCRVADTGWVDPDPDPTLEKQLGSGSCLTKFNLNYFLYTSLKEKFVSGKILEEFWIFRTDQDPTFFPYTDTDPTTFKHKDPISLFPKIEYGSNHF